MNDDLTPEQLAAPSQVAKDKRPTSAAQAMTEFALDTMRLVRGQDGEVYAIADDSALALPMRGAGGLRKQLIRNYRAETGKVANAQALTDCLAAVEAEGFEAEQVSVYTRVAPGDGGVLVDLGRVDKQVVHVTGNGWTIRPLTAGDPVFIRPTYLGELPLPRPGRVEDLWTLINVHERDQMLVLGFMVSAYLPWVQMPILL